MDRHFHALRRALCLAACLLALPAAWAGQTKYPALVVFGDSLSDTGNDFVGSTAQGAVPAIPPSVSPHATYWQGRFSNGPVAVEYLWRLISRKNTAEVTPSLTDPALAKPALSFAFGGSTVGDVPLSPLGFPVPTLGLQVDQFTAALGNRRASDKALYVVWSGANDYLQLAAIGQAADPHTVVAKVAGAIRTLYGRGARDFLVPNLANLGATPFAQAQGLGGALTQQSKTHNGLLKLALASLERELRQIRIVEVDVYKLGELVLSSGLVLADKTALGEMDLTPVNDGGALPLPPAEWCLFVLPARPRTCPDATTKGFVLPYMFWDVMHPTTQVHGVLGTAMFGALLTQR